MKAIVKKGKSKSSLGLQIDSRLQKAIISEYKDVKKCEECDKYEVECSESNMLKWNFKMYNACFLEEAPQLFHDLDQHSLMFKRPPCIKFEMLFPYNFPESPPFVRIVYPRFKQYTGHITVGGSICTRILTNGSSTESWNPNMKISTLLLTLQTILIHAQDDTGKPAQAKVQNYAEFPHYNPGYEYSAEEAREAFKRAARQHNWSIDDLDVLFGKA